jgi:hypothetical protein
MLGQGNGHGEVSPGPGTIAAWGTLHLSGRGSGAWT